MVAKTKPDGHGLNLWYCPECGKWFKARTESYTRGVLSTYCTKCGLNLEEDTEYTEELLSRA